MKYVASSFHIFVISANAFSGVFSAGRIHKHFSPGKVIFFFLFLFWLTVLEFSFPAAVICCERKPPQRFWSVSGTKRLAQWYLVLRAYINHQQTARDCDGGDQKHLMDATECCARSVLESHMFSRATCFRAAILTMQLRSIA